MGVRGLTSYINKNQNLFLEEYNLYNTNLVIDGLSLCNQLYRLSRCFSAFGGNYDEIASCMKTFCKKLRKCNVTPYVIFDGCHETRKMKTVLCRLNSKLKSVSQLNPKTQDSLKIFPYLLRDVFREVLIEMNIAYTICEFEADYEIAALARHLNCPVLSYDSDFFIYNVLYIPFNMLDTKVKQIELEDNEVYVLQCKLYRTQYLCEHFGFNEELLPLLATLLGNDFVEKQVFSKFFDQLKLPDAKGKRKMNDEQQEICALFKWLKNETFVSAVNKILGMFTKDQKNKVYGIIKKSVDTYHYHSCKSQKYFNIQTDQSTKLSEYKMPDVGDISNDQDDVNIEVDEKDLASTSNEDKKDEEQAHEISSPHSDSLPVWFADKIRKNLIPTSYLNLYACRLHICNPQVENFTEKDSFLSVLPIVRYAFDILTDFRHDNFSYFSRDHCNYQELSIGKEYSVERPLNIPYEQLTDTQLRQYFKHFFDIKLKNLDYNEVKLLPTNFQLFMISILWWISYCSVPAAHVHSLICSYIMLEIIDEKTGGARNHYKFNKKNWQKLEQLRQKCTKTRETDELFLDKNKVLSEDCLVAASVLLKHFQKPESYDIKKIHSFAQFQCALQQINALDVLCCSQFESTTFYKSYNGEFIYNMAVQLENQADPVTFLVEYIKGANTVIMFYKSICNIYNKLLQKMNISTAQWSGKRSMGRQEIKEQARKRKRF